ncbi:MAG: hypothetical protein H0T79_21640 [Deltaproteobacteria bacterium]|nr:hypothetical protein [Deltaproteobacteria bacterium]
MALLASHALVGCTDRRTPAPAPQVTAAHIEPATPQRAPTGPAAPEETTGIPGSKNLAGLANLIPILQDEARTRPAVKVTPETLFDSLTTAGLEVTQRKQVLAKSVSARFCALGKIDSTAGVIGVVACEYETPELARKSRVEQDRNSVTNVAREVNGATLVVVTNVAANPDKQKRIFEVLKSL